MKWGEYFLSDQLQLLRVRLMCLAQTLFRAGLGNIFTGPGRTRFGTLKAE